MGNTGFDDFRRTEKRVDPWSQRYQEFSQYEDLTRYRIDQ